MKMTAKQKIRNAMSDPNKQMDIMLAIKSIVYDKEFFCGGIPAIDSELQAKGFTSKQCADIEYGLYCIAKKLAAKI